MIGQARPDTMHMVYMQNYLLLWDRRHHHGGIIVMGNIPSLAYSRAHHTSVVVGIDTAQGGALVPVLVFTIVSVHHRTNCIRNTASVLARNWKGKRREGGLGRLQPCFLVLPRGLWVCTWLNIYGRDGEANYATVNTSRVGPALRNSIQIRRDAGWHFEKRRVAQ